MPNFSQLQKLKRNVQQSRPKISQTKVEASLRSELPPVPPPINPYLENVLLNYELSEPQQQQTEGEAQVIEPELQAAVTEQLVIKLANTLRNALQQFIQDNLNIQVVEGNHDDEDEEAVGNDDDIDGINEGECGGLPC